MRTQPPGPVHVSVQEPISGGGAFTTLSAGTPRYVGGYKGSLITFQSYSAGETQIKLLWTKQRNEIDPTFYTVPPEVDLHIPAAAPQCSFHVINRADWLSVLVRNMGAASVVDCIVTPTDRFRQDQQHFRATNTPLAYRTASLLGAGGTSISVFDPYCGPAMVQVYTDAAAWALDLEGHECGSGGVPTYVFGRQDSIPAANRVLAAPVTVPPLINELHFVNLDAAAKTVQYHVWPVLGE